MRPVMDGSGHLDTSSITGRNFYCLLLTVEGVSKATHSPLAISVVVKPLACLLQYRSYACRLRRLVLQPLLFAFFVIAALAFQKIVSHIAVLFL